MLASWRGPATDVQPVMSRVSALAINAADHLVVKGRLDAAASILRNYLATNPPKPEILQRLGRILLALGRSEEAIPLLQQALSEFNTDDLAQDDGSALPAETDGTDPVVTHTQLTDAASTAVDAEIS